MNVFATQGLAHSGAAKTGAARGGVPRARAETRAQEEHAASCKHAHAQAERTNTV
jgi:hypothetical protein